MSTKLTSTQQKILDYIEEAISKMGYPPSVREIGEAVGLKSSSTVHSHLKNLERLGLIKRDSTKPRAIVTKTAEDDRTKPNTSDAVFHNEIVEIPILGRISAGRPISAIEEHDAYFPVPASMVRGGAYFMLKIKGDSMVKKGILDGDYVIIKEQSEARNGEMAACLIGDEATVKTFYREQDHFRLQPENDNYKPILLKEVSVLGVVKGVVRTL